MNILKIKKHYFDCELYQPIIIGEVDELIKRLKSLEQKFPLVAKCFLKILEKNFAQRFSLEDWLIIIPYQFIWNSDDKSLKWFEELFKQVANHYEKAFEEWITEISQKCNTTNDICDRIYNYLLHIYAAVYLIRSGYTNIQFPLRSEKKDVDIVAFLKEQPFAIECKFKKTSNKFESCFWRIHRAFRDCVNTSFHKYTQKTLLISKNFIFPSAKNINNLLSLHYTAIKFLIKEVYQDLDSPHTVFLKDKNEVLAYKYFPSLPSATSIDLQQYNAEKKASYFFENSLSETLDTAIMQLNNSKYVYHKKIIFLGIQFDELFLIDWTYPSIEKIKSLAVLKMHKNNIEIIFSEDVGFGVAEYL